jgi:hypothetical protein
MTGREKIEAAFSARGTREVPAVICYEYIYLRDHWDDITSRPWWTVHDPEIDRQMAWIHEFVAKTGQDWFGVSTFYSREDRENLVIDETPAGVFLCDRRTGGRKPLERPRLGGWSPSGGAASIHPADSPQTFDEIDQAIALPDENEDVVADGRGDLAARMIAEFGDRLFPLGGAISPLWLCYEVWGFEGMMTLVADRPEIVRHACKRYLERELRQVRRMAAIGAAGIWLEECMTDMIGPAAFASLCVPWNRRLVEEIRALGMKSIYYFCGNPAGKWELLLATGADALSLEEGKKGFEIDIEDVVDRVAGRSTVLGNLDAINVLPNASDDELKREIARQVAAGRRNHGRFIMSIGSPVTPGTTIERVRRYCEMVHEK